MRLDVRRPSGEARYRPLPANDRRGRHTKHATPEERRDMREAYNNVMHAQRPCGCDMSSAPVVYSDGYITCTGCGLVLEQQVFEPRCDYYGGDGGNGVSLDTVHRMDPTWWNTTLHTSKTSHSKPYEHENHAAERLKSAVDADPRMPPYLLELLGELWNQRYRGVADPDYSDILEAGQRDIAALLGSIDPKLVRQYGERWLQIKIAICGRPFYDVYGPPLMPFKLCHIVHARYRCFARTFVALRREGHPLFRTRKNVSQLNATLVQMMAQESPQHIDLYGWYFPLLCTLGKRVITEYRIRTVISYIERLGFGDNYHWQYVPVMLETDRILFAAEPELPLELLLRELRDCGCLPKLSKSLSTRSRRRSSTSRCRRRKPARR